MYKQINGEKSPFATFLLYSQYLLFSLFSVSEEEVVVGGGGDPWQYTEYWLPCCTHPLLHHYLTDCFALPIQMVPETGHWP
jgi:hypothetical protein